MQHSDTTGSATETDDAESSSLGSAALQGARVRFRSFFLDVQERFFEREDALAQVGLAVLGKQHVLITGPPGTAKSALSTTVLGNIVDHGSGEPSLFARQFTESTVQTDLVGPLDFKTLMESGRSEHFTDEGMLGAVHAFLDEVLDGRDMLLRSTLNVLHERELKQGTKTTKGLIECALMTTNRYLAEVIEQSRETLLAFIDRIAFVSFVPKGFSEPESLVALLGQLQRGGQRRPLPLLTIQDLDLLQELVDDVEVPEHCHRALVDFLQRFEAELAAATRADPSFVPTRYVSTRTAVRTAQLLKVICVYDWVMGDGTRDLRVRHSDFERLRLTLLLSGPTPAQLPTLLSRETDPRERRQLTILQTERRIFDSVLEAMPQEPAPEPPQVVRAPSIVGLRNKTIEDQIAVCERLTKAAAEPGPRGRKARGRLREATSIVAYQALSSGLQAGLEDQDGRLAVNNLMRLASHFDGVHHSARELAPWLRSRALQVLEAQLEVSSATADVAREITESAPSAESARQVGDAQLERLVHHAQVRSALIAGGATPGPRTSEIWSAAITRVEDALVQVWEQAMLSAVEQQLTDGKGIGLDETLATLAAPLEEIDRHADRLSELGEAPSQLTSRVVGTKLLPLLRRAFEVQALTGRLEVAAAVDRLLEKLDDAEIHSAVSSDALIEWTAEALLKAEVPVEIGRHTLTYGGYREFRAAQPRVSICFAFVKVCSHVASYSDASRQQFELGLDGVRQLLTTLNDALRDRVVEADARRVTAALEFFEAWWGELRDGQLSPAERLSKVIESRINRLLDEENALMRFALEAQLIGDLFPTSKELSQQLHARLLEVNNRITSDLASMLQERADAGWQNVVTSSNER